MMCIAIYTGHLPAEKEKWHTGHWFTYEMVNRFLSSHPEEKFLLLSDEPVTDLFPQNESVECMALGKMIPRVLPLYRRFNYKIPACLRHAEARVLVSMQGILPLKIKIPSCLLLTDDNAIDKKVPLKEGPDRYRRRYLPRFLQKTDQVVTLSGFYKQQLMSQYQVPEHKIAVIGSGISALFRPLDWEAREKVKAQYADGKEYLLYAGDIDANSNMINLLKAFSILKKKMFSGMVLVLAGKTDAAFKKFPELLRTYHFRKDVKLTGEVDLAERARLTGGAYARVIPSAKVNFSSPVPEALQCRTPILAAKSPVHEERGGDAALYFNAADFRDMGALLCELYKNEELRARLIAQADEKVKAFSWEQTADRFWEAIRSALQATKK